MAHLCKTTIRMGAAHYDLHMRVGEMSSKVNLAEVLHGLGPRDRNSHLSGVAEIICKAHGITYKTAPIAPRKVTSKKASAPRKSLFVPRGSVADLTMEATL